MRRVANYVNIPIAQNLDVASGITRKRIVIIGLDYDSVVFLTSVGITYNVAIIKNV